MGRQIVLCGRSAHALLVPAREDERPDGTGYPDRELSEQIELDVRILAVCDVYDALISKRVYRDAWSPVQALRTLKAEEGTAFDGRCVAALEQVVTTAEGLPSRTRVPAGHHSRLVHGHS